MLSLVCALNCEAASLVKHFNLKSFLQNSLFPVYRNDSIFLTVCGIGKIAAAAATAYLYGLMGEQASTAWINVGIAGHASYPIGQGFYAHQVIDQGNLRTFYPTFTWKDQVCTETLLTVDQQVAVFSQEGIYEMEAAGFCFSAFSLTTSELIHCYKVISDNSEIPARKDPHYVQELIESHLTVIERLINRLCALQAKLDNWSSVSEVMQPFLQKWHFTQTELFQLQRCLQRWEALCAAEPIFDESLNHCKTAKAVLMKLNQKLCFL